MQTMSGYGLIRDTELEKLKLESRAYPEVLVDASARQLRREV